MLSELNLRVRTSERSVLLAALVLVTLVGCARYGTVKQRFAYDYSCKKPLVVESVAGGKYVVSGCNRRATYICVGRTCLPEDAPGPRSGAQRHAAGGRSSAKVERGFDEKHQRDMVRAKFRLAGGARLTLIAIPAVELDTVYARLSIPKTHLEADCAGFELLINRRPSEAPEKPFELRKSRLSVALRFKFESFKPLASRYPEFGVRYCGREVKFDEQQVEELRKFLVIHGELAQEVEQQTAPEPTGTTTL